MKEQTDRTRSAIARHRTALTSHRAHRGRAEAEEVTAAGRDVLDAATELHRTEVAVTELTSQPRTHAIDPPDDWPPYEQTYAVVLNVGSHLLGYHTRGRCWSFPTPERITERIGSHAVTVATDTGRLLILDAYTHVWRALPVDGRRQP